MDFITQFIFFGYIVLCIIGLIIFIIFTIKIYTIDEDDMWYLIKCAIIASMITAIFLKLLVFS